MGLHHILLLLSIVFLTGCTDDQLSGLRRQSCTCKPKAQCAAEFSDSGLESCSLTQGKRGFCCPDILSTRRSPPLLSTRTSSNPSSQLPSGITEGDIRNFISKSASPSTPRGREDKETRGHRLFTKAKKENKDLYDYARKLLFDVGIDLRQRIVSADNSDTIRDDCPWLNDRKPSCRPNPVYRTVDG